jgi:hypothetical protein
MVMNQVEDTPEPRRTREQLRPEQLAHIERLELEHGHAFYPVRMSDMEGCAVCEKSKQARLELERLAAPLYKDMLSPIPFYQERMNDARFWRQYIGSRVLAARALVARTHGLESFQGESA